MREKDNFNYITSILSITLCTLLIIKGIKDSFTIGIIIAAALNAVYIPGLLIFKKRFFINWLLLYCFTQVIIIATFQADLFNNFSALFAIFVAMLIKPEYKHRFLIAYFILITVTFIIMEQELIEYLIHITRSISCLYLLYYFLETNYTRKALDLKEDEIKILEELNEKKLLKACTTFSKNTITQKLKEARERNNINTNAELLAEYNLMIKK